MGLFKDLRGLVKDAKDLEEQAGGRPSLSEGISQARDMMATAKESIADQQSGGADTGVPAQATIKAMRDTGMTINQNPVAELDLAVEYGSGPPYDVTTRQTLPRLQIGQIQPGVKIEVKVDPNDLTKVTLA